MPIRQKTFILSVFTIAIISIVAFFLYKMPFYSHLISNIPAPSEENPYILIDVQNYSYPKPITAFLTEGGFPSLRERATREILLSIAAVAKDAAVLLEQERENRVEVYAALRFEKNEMDLLKKGILPDLLKEVIANSNVDVGGNKNSWRIQTDTGEPLLYYSLNNECVIMTTDSSSLNLMHNLAFEDRNSLSNKKWMEKSWSSHIEICDAGMLSSFHGKNTPIKIEVAWQPHKNDKKSDPIGKAKWEISGIDKNISKFISDTYTPTKWDFAECIIPEPLLISLGVNISNLKGSGKNWPFPLNNLAKMGESMELGEGDIQDILSGKTVLSVGGLSRLLWFNLPGFMIEFSAEKQVLKKLVAAFWEKLFSGSEPNPAAGFEFGGTASLPFSAMAVTNERIALLGLISIESIKSCDILSMFLKENDEVIGWLTADLPRIGDAITEVAKIGFLIDDESCFKKSSQSKEKTETEIENSTNKELFQSEMDFFSYNLNAAESFSNLLQNLGRVFIVWEKSNSGQLYWLNSTKNK